MKFTTDDIMMILIHNKGTKKEFVDTMNEFKEQAADDKDFLYMVQSVLDKVLQFTDAEYEYLIKSLIP